MTPEQKARVGIDALLVQAGWHVCNVANANIHAATGVAIREFPLNNGFGFADYLLYVNGKACGVIEARRSGRGQVIDAAMVDSASLMTTMFAGMLAAGQWRDERGVNLLDTGAPWYDSYATQDGLYVAIGALDKDNIHTPGIYVDRVVKGATFEKRIERVTTRSRAQTTKEAV